MGRHCQPWPCSDPHRARHAAGLPGVFWPVTGLTQRFENVACGGIYRIREGADELVVVAQPRTDRQ